MRQKRKRKQREEVRHLLAAMRKELAKHRLAYEALKSEPIRLNELISKAKKAVD